jgi:aspartate aminotransferase
MFDPSAAIQRIIASSQRPVSRPGPGVIALSSGDPDFVTPEHIRQALADAILTGYTNYGHNQGDPELRAALASQASDVAGRSFSPEQVIVTHGGSGAIAASLFATVNPGERVLLAEPTYSLYADVLQLIGAVPVTVPQTLDFHLDLERLRAEAAGARMVIICHPNNPTGAVYTRAELEGLAEIAREHDLLVMADEAYAAIVFDGVDFTSTLAVEALAERLLYCQTFSKTYAMTGWRLGYVLAPLEIAPHVARAHRTVTGPINTAIQRAALVAVTVPSEAPEQMRREYQARRELIAELLAGVPGTEASLPDGTFYYFIRCTEGQVPENIAAAALEHGVAVRDGREYGPSGAGYFRITFAKDRPTLTEGILRLRSMILSWQDTPGS